MPLVLATGWYETPSKVVCAATTPCPLAETVKAVVSYRGALKFDTSKPDGTPRKLVDVSRMSALGWQASTPLEQGLRSAYQDFREQLAAGGARTA